MESKREPGYSLPLNTINDLVHWSPEICTDFLSCRFKLDSYLLRHRYAESYGTVSPANQLPFDGIPELAVWIVESGGVNIALTQGMPKVMGERLKAHELDGLFQHVVRMEDEILLSLPQRNVVGLYSRRRSTLGEGTRFPYGVFLAEQHPCCRYFFRKLSQSIADSKNSK